VRLNIDRLDIVRLNIDWLDIDLKPGGQTIVQSC
jgi:hypothetical protein